MPVLWKVICNQKKSVALNCRFLEPSYLGLLKHLYIIIYRQYEIVLYVVNDQRHQSKNVSIILILVLGQYLLVLAKYLHIMTICISASIYIVYIVQYCIRKKNIKTIFCFPFVNMMFIFCIYLLIKIYGINCLLWKLMFKVDLFTGLTFVLRNRASIKICQCKTGFLVICVFFSQY